MNGLSLKTNTGNAMMAEGMLDVKVSSSHQCSYVHGMVRGSESEVIWESPWVGERDLWGVWSCLVCLASVRWPSLQPPFWQPPSDYLHNIYFKLKKKTQLKVTFFQILVGRLEKNPEVSFFEFLFTISPHCSQQKLLWKLSRTCSNFAQLFQSFTLVINIKTFCFRIKKF